MTDFASLAAPVERALRGTRERVLAAHPGQPRIHDPQRRLRTRRADADHPLEPRAPLCRAHRLAELVEVDRELPRLLGG